MNLVNCILSSEQNIKITALLLWSVHAAWLLAYCSLAAAWPVSVFLLLNKLTDGWSTPAWSWGYVHSDSTEYYTSSDDSEPQDTSDVKELTNYSDIYPHSMFVDAVKQCNWRWAIDYIRLWTRSVASVEQCKNEQWLSTYPRYYCHYIYSCAVMYQQR